MAKAIDAFDSIDVLVSNAGIQIVEALDQFQFKQWKKLLAIYLDGAFLTTRAALRQMYKQGTGGSIIYMGSVHSKEASKLRAPSVTAKHGLIVVAKEGAQRACAPMSFALTSCARHSSTSRSPSKPKSL